MLIRSNSQMMEEAGKKTHTSQNARLKNSATNVKER